MNKRKEIFKDREGMEHPVDSHDVDFGEHNKAIMLSFSNLKDSSESTNVNSSL